MESRFCVLFKYFSVLTLFFFLLSLIFFLLMKFSFFWAIVEDIVILCGKYSLVYVVHIYYQDKLKISPIYNCVDGDGNGILFV